MSRLDRERIAAYARSHPVRSVFVLLVSVPATLAAFSFRQPVPLPDAILSELELLFRLFVYAPVDAVRSVLFEPLGLDVLFAIPGLQQTTVVLTLLGFYYLVSLVVVRLGYRLDDRFSR